MLAGLGVTLAVFAHAASASVAVFPEPGGIDAPVTDPAPVIHTVVVGGMPGWQIALIAAGTALIVAVVAVLFDRARSARRRPASLAA